MLVFPPQKPQDSRTSNNPLHGKPFLGGKEHWDIRRLGRPENSEAKAFPVTPFFLGAVSGDPFLLPLEAKGRL